VAGAGQLLISDVVRSLASVPLLYGGPRSGRKTYAVFFEDPDRIKIEVVAPLPSADAGCSEQPQPHH
jgi:hypothetical protein